MGGHYPERFGNGGDGADDAPAPLSKQPAREGSKHKKTVFGLQSVVFGYYRYYRAMALSRQNIVN
ncbi:hypothetical protein GCM10027578_06880 [Spirosoma luteolum]